MGSEFFWFLDLLTVAVLAVYLYRGGKKGAVGVLISAAAAIIAFIAAFALCGPISDTLYNKLIREKVEVYVDENINNVFNGGAIPGLSEVDLSKTVVKDVPLSEMVIDYDETGKANIDLSEVDLTETGIENADLSAFGIGEDFDFSSLKPGLVTVTEDEVEKYGLENVVLARVITDNIASDDIEQAFSEIGDKLAGTYSAGLKELGKDLSNGGRDAVYNVVATVITASDADYGGQIMDSLVTPTVLPPLKIIVFLILFALVLLILSIIASVTKLVNLIPVAGTANRIIGAVLGIAEGVIVMIIICIVMKFLITVCGNSLVFINEPTIEKTFIFRFLYDTDPLKLAGIGS